MKVWISRDRQSSTSSKVVVWDIKPEYFPTQENWYLGNPADAELMAMSPREFNRLFGFTPRKGTCKEGELSLKEIRK